MKIQKLRIPAKLHLIVQTNPLYEISNYLSKTYKFSETITCSFASINNFFKLRMKQNEPFKIKVG